MNRFLSLLPAAAAAALLVPLAMSGRPSHADAAAPQVQPNVLVAAVEQAEAERRAATAPAASPAKQAAALDRVAGAAQRIDPDRIDPKIALSALAR